MNYEQRNLKYHSTQYLAELQCTPAEANKSNETIHTTKAKMFLRAQRMMVTWETSKEKDEDRNRPPRLSQERKMIIIS